MPMLVSCGRCLAALEVPDRPDEDFLCATCTAHIAEATASPADLRPIRLIGHREGAQ